MRTSAPRGQTPGLRVPLTWDHLSAISALTTRGRILKLVQESALRGPGVVCLLRHRLRHMAGKLLVIWDGAHRSIAARSSRTFWLTAAQNGCG